MARRPDPTFARPRPSRGRSPRRQRWLGAAAIAGLIGTLALVSWLAGWLPSGEPDDARVALEGAPTIVYAEYSEAADRIYTAPAEAPNERTLIDTVPHAPGWAITPAPAVVNGLTAFTVLPPEASAGRHAPAELWLMTLADGTRTRLARDADLLVPPVLSPDGSMLLYRTSLLYQQQEIVRVDLATRGRRVLHVEQSSFGVFPVGFDEDGRALITRLSTAGVDLLRLEHPEPPTLLAHLSDDLARDWRLSADGSRLAYLEPVIERETVRWVPRVRHTADGTLAPLEVPDGSYLAPVFEPTSGALTAGLLAGEGASGVALLSANGAPATLAASASGFDLPLAWTADGRWLAARHFDGPTLGDPGRDTVVVIGRDGERHRIDLPREVILLGWFHA